MINLLNKFDFDVVVKRNYSFFVVLLSFLPQIIYTQSSNIGISPITNFFKKDYQAGTQNWDITQDKNGLLYFANNGGLLEFDGTNWRVYPVSNQTIVRSVKIHTNGQIYVGAQNELGYFEANEKGILVYHSLMSLLSTNLQNFADVWDIEIIGEAIYFRTGSNVLLYQNNQITEIYTNGVLANLSQIEGTLYLHDLNKGLLRYNGTQFKSHINSELLQDISISTILPHKNDTLLIGTLKKGLLLYANNQLIPWEINDNNLIQQGRIYCGTIVDEETYAFGTSLNGLFIINKAGKVIKYINNKSGLQVNNVLSVFVDKKQNLWTGLNHGIALIEISSPFSHIQPDENTKAAGYAVQIFEDNIYLGTSSGAYYTDWNRYYNPTQQFPFKKLPKSDGQVWNLKTDNQTLFMHHHEGVFSVADNKVQLIHQDGSWLHLPVATDKLLVGMYNGLGLLENQGNWVEANDFRQQWVESCRIMEQDEAGNIWVSHPYRGVFKVVFKPDYSAIEVIEHYDSKDGFPSDYQIYLFKIGDELVFCAEQGIYQYNATANTFEPNPKWNTIFGEHTQVNRLIEAPNGDIWFVTNNNVGVLEVKDGGVYKTTTTRFFPQLKPKLIQAFEKIYPFDEHNVFFPAELGFIHFNPHKRPADTSFTTLIRMVKSIYTDSLLYGGNGVQQAILSLPYSENALDFTFAATYFENSEANEYQYYLEGLEKTWSSWTTKTRIEYTNLNSGDYTLHVRAKNIHDHLSNVATYSFKISAPWYASKLAFSIYTLLILAFIFSLIFIPKKIYEIEKAALQSQQEETLQQQEQQHLLIEKEQQQQIDALEKAKLELEIRAKNQELASNTMHLVQKSEMLQKIKDDIRKITKTSKDTDTVKELKKVVRKISADERLDDDWKQFARYFDQVHGQFLKRLRAAYPQLTPKDHRLCAYLRMNLSSKEIAPLMNISVRSVEVARYRLRKKLEIEGEVNLVDFMLGF